MGLFGALTTSVAGLAAQAFSLQNISGNIANSQTTAYKSIGTNFQDIVESVGATAQESLAGSVRAVSTSSNSVQGAVNSTGVATNMAINGQGYFQVQLKVGQTDGSETFSGTNVYTRAGDFTMDKQGYLVNGTGAALMAIPIDPSTHNPVGDTPQLLQISTGYLKANATTTITYQANLPATPSVGTIIPADFTTDPTTLGGGSGVVAAQDNATFQSQSLAGSSTTAYTSDGTAVNVQMRWAEVSSSPTPTWNLFYQSNPSATGTQAMWTNTGTAVTFSSNGTMVSPASGALTVPNMTINGTQLGNIKMNFGTGGLTQYDSAVGTVNVGTLSQNGYTSGSLTTVGVNAQGEVTASYSNGQQVPVAQVPLYKFNGAAALTVQSGGIYVPNDESGAAVKMATTDITGGALEASNTDIASQFSQMIVTQQAYSANSKIITTANSMMQDVMNIIR